ncbi:hypothetical protein PP175_19075 [Aneurinibacillus sp. Ricciae_BoGa-3]|uniref:hypothetical protein n=1 Tax=Aneurinibacillus sp. Ricciae_BoGa-3 TaxID=3022697 RepID=UPI0023420AF9|nr:hypothetical protein [Aneurinibacillus sp. Ricciae_BoGa-3]WCK53432.1 hypothetical protein PP175_19075 [Aneurinibacillus sp. Ricciae_BoGa-3]
MTTTEAISYLIISLHHLGYPYKEIRRIRKEYEVRLNLHSEEKVEMEAAILIAKLIKEGVETVDLMIYDKCLTDGFDQSMK